MMRTLVLGDVHNNVDRVDEIVAYEKPELTVIVGDLHDSWGHGRAAAKKTAQWQAARIRDPAWKLLMGNHDAQYAFGKGIFNPCGANKSKKYTIDRFIRPIDWHQMPLFFEHQGFVISHAGIHPRFLENGPWSTEFGQVTQEIFWRNPYHCWVNVVGRSRGGDAIAGGALWCDYYAEFEPVPGLKQIFGHSHCSEIATKDGLNFCIETSLKEYLILTDGKMGMYRWEPIAKVGAEI